MPPRKPTAGQPLPRGQASLQSFFGAKPPSSGSQANTPSSNKPAATQPSPSPPVSSSVILQVTDRITVRASPRKHIPKPEPSFASASTTARGSNRSHPLVLDDSDLSDDDNAMPPAPSPPSPKPSTAPRASAASVGAKRKSLAASRDSDDDDDDDDQDFHPEPKPKKPATSRTTTAHRKLISDSDPDSEDMHHAPAPKSKPKPKPNWKQIAATRAAGPSDPGSKEIPNGQRNCLAGLTIVFTGELSSLSRDEAQDLAKRYGARITSGPSSRTSYVVLGQGAGAKKVEMIKKNKIPTLDEDGFLDLIATRGAGELDEKAKKKIAEEEKKVRETAKAMAAAVKEAPEDLSNALWTTKYAPKSIKDLAGNKSAVDKLQAWLKAWPASFRSNFTKPGPHGINVYRALLLSGPPGIGKTTSAHLTAKLEGYTPIEFNASDTRSKKLIESMIKDTIDNKSLDGWYSGGGGRMIGTSDVRITHRTVLIMDEVDGMSGGDRGGIGAINALIKKTKVPIICICNDRKAQKMRPLENTTGNLTFRKPDAGAVKSRMLSIAFREKLKVPGEVIGQLIEAAQGDIRSVINMLSTWKLSRSTMDFDEAKQLGLENAKPGMHTPFTLYSELSSPYMFSQTSRKTLNDKTELYFQDHSFVPLMVAENYVKSRPVRAAREADSERLKGQKHLELLRNAAESISDGDMIDRMIHGSEQHWSLMPLHAIASTVRPCSFTYGATEGGFPGFPSWLGQNSKQQRLSRAVVDLQARMRLSCSGSRHDVRQHYLPTLWPMLIDPLVDKGVDGVEDVIQVMDDYYLGIEDREAILELGVEPNNAETVVKRIPATVKAAFTRKYNAANHPIAFYKGVETGSKAKQLKGEPAPDLEDVVEEDEVPDEVEEGDEGSDDDISKDKMVKRPKTTGKTAAGAKSKAKAKK